MLCARSSPDIGSVAPLFELKSATGDRIALADLRGQPVVLAFHPPGWDPSRADQLTHFQSLLSRIPGAPAELVGISDEGIWCRVAFAHDEIRVPMLTNIDSSGAVAQRFGVAGQHAVFLVDADGVIQWSHLGAISAGGVDALISALTPLEDMRMRADEREISSDAAAPLFIPTRRDFVSTLLAAAVVLAAKPAVAKAERAARVLASHQTSAASTVSAVTLNVNGRDVALMIEPRVTLLDALREYAGLTGTKKGCDHGQCGACTVHVDGRRQLSCLSFAMMQQGKKITTVEGLADGDALHPMQAAFIKHDGFQCGYCTPGQLMSATALLTEPCGTADNDVKECMSGNICRCGAYPGIVAAIQDVRGNARRS